MKNQEQKKCLKVTLDLTSRRPSETQRLYGGSQINHPLPSNLLGSQLAKNLFESLLVVKVFWIKFQGLSDRFLRL